MALVTQFTCTHCNQSKYELVTRNRICETCRTAIDKIDTEAYMAKLTVLPLEERVKRIELTLYKLNLQERLHSIEIATARY